MASKTKLTPRDLMHAALAELTGKAKGPDANDEDADDESRGRRFDVRDDRMVATAIERLRATRPPLNRALGEATLALRS